MAFAIHRPFGYMPLEMKAFKLVSIYLIVLALGLYFVWQKNHEPNLPNIEIPVTNLQNKTIDFAKVLPKKPHLIHLWATWCDPCVEEIPELIKRFNNKADQDFPVFLVSYDSEWKEVLEMLPEKLPPNFVLILDREQKTHPFLKMPKLPSTIYMGKNQREIRLLKGKQNWKTLSFSELRR